MGAFILQFVTQPKAQRSVNILVKGNAELEIGLMNLKCSQRDNFGWRDHCGVYQCLTHRYTSLVQTESSLRDMQFDKLS